MNHSNMEIFHGLAYDLERKTKQLSSFCKKQKTYIEYKHLRYFFKVSLDMNSNFASEKFTSNVLVL